MLWPHTWTRIKRAAFRAFRSPSRTRTPEQHTQLTNPQRSGRVLVAHLTTLPRTRFGVACRVSSPRLVVARDRLTGGGPKGEREVVGSTSRPNDNDRRLAHERSRDEECSCSDSRAREGRAIVDWADVPPPPPAVNAETLISEKGSLTVLGRVELLGGEG